MFAILHGWRLEGMAASVDPVVMEVVG